MESAKRVEKPKGPPVVSAAAEEGLDIVMEGTAATVVPVRTKSDEETVNAGERASNKKEKEKKKEKSAEKKGTEKKAKGKASKKRARSRTIDDSTHTEDTTRAPKKAKVDQAVKKSSKTLDKEGTKEDIGALDQPVDKSVYLTKKQEHGEGEGPGFAESTAGCLYLQTGKSFADSNGACLQVVNGLKTAGVVGAKSIVADGKGFRITFDPDAELDFKGTKIKLGNNTCILREYRTGGCSKFIIKSFGGNVGPKIVIAKFLEHLQTAHENDDRVPAPSALPSFKVRRSVIGGIPSDTLFLHFDASPGLKRVEFNTAPQGAAKEWKVTMWPVGADQPCANCLRLEGVSRLHSDDAVCHNSMEITVDTPQKTGKEEKAAVKGSDKSASGKKK